MRDDKKRTASGMYRAQPRDPVTGRRISITARTYSELQSRLYRIEEIRRDVSLGADPVEAAKKLRPAASGALTLQDAWNRYLETRLKQQKPKAEQAWRNWISPHLSPELRLFELTAERLKRWEVWLTESKKLSPASRSLAYSFLSGALNLLIPADLTALPWGKWRPKGPPKDQFSNETAARSLAELEALAKAAHEYDERNRERGIWSNNAAAVLVAALCGLRNAELAGLAWDCCEIDAEPFVLHIRYQAPKGWAKWWPGPRPLVPPKDKKAAAQVLHPTAAAVLRAQRAALLACGRFRQDGPVFPNDDGSWRLSGYVLRGATVREVARRAGIPDWQQWRPHSFRHTMATLETGLGGDLKAVQGRMRHSDLRITQRYQHALGRGLPVSPLPLVSAQLPPETEALALPGPELVPAAPRVLKSVSGGNLSLWELARVHLDAAQAGSVPADERPRAVTQRARQAYTAAYNRARATEGKSREEAQKAGRDSKRAVLAAWGRALAEARRARANASEAPPKSA